MRAGVAVHGDGARRRLEAAPARGRRGRAGHGARRCSRATRTRCCPRSATCTCCRGACRRARRSWRPQPGQAIVEEIRRRSTAALPRDRRPRGRGSRARRRRGDRRHHRAARARRRRAPRGVGPAGARDDRALVLAALRASRAAYASGRTGRFAAATETVTGLEARAGASTGARGCGARGQATVGPGAQLPRAARARVRRAVRIAVAACGAQFGPIFEHLAERAAGRVRLAGRPELPRHARPARADDERVRRDLARLPGEPAARADPARDGLRRAARRPRLRRPGRELDD